MLHASGELRVLQHPCDPVVADPGVPRVRLLCVAVVLVGVVSALPGHIGQAKKKAPFSGILSNAST